MKRTYLTVSIIIFLMAIFGYLVFSNKDLNSTKQELANFYLRKKTEMEQSNLIKKEPSQSSGFEYEVIAEDLEIPWEVVFLPDGEVLITERPGTLIKIDGETKNIEIEGVKHTGEGGLLGAVLHPDFETNNYLYLYVTSDSEDAGTINRVERYVFKDDGLTDKTEIISDIPGASYHDGGRIEFGPDGKLYITTGDAGNKPSSQDLNSLAGKILRLNDDGTVPEDNPYNSPVYSYGHRNPQGIAWDDEGRMWSTEHGRSGNASGFDELNLIEKGGNYGWPEIQGDEEKQDMIKPVLHSGPSTTWAPAGLEFYNGKLYFAGLRGATLYEVDINDVNNPALQELFAGEFGRLRAVKKDNSGNLYVTTSNRDGRGKVNKGDDKLIKFY